MAKLTHVAVSVFATAHAELDLELSKVRNHAPVAVAVLPFNNPRLSIKQIYS